MQISRLPLVLKTQKALVFLIKVLYFLESLSLFKDWGLQTRIAIRIKKERQLPMKVRLKVNKMYSRFLKQWVKVKLIVCKLNPLLLHRHQDIALILPATTSSLTSGKCTTTTPGSTCCSEGPGLQLVRSSRTWGRRWTMRHRGSGLRAWGSLPRWTVAPSSRFWWTRLLKTCRPRPRSTSPPSLPTATTRLQPVQIFHI